MYKNSLLKVIVSALLLAPVMAKAQGTIDDYKRAYSLYNKFNATHVYGNAENIKWEGNGIFHYTAYTPEGLTYYIGQTSPDVSTTDVKAVNMEALAALLSKEAGREIKRNSVRLENFKVNDATTSTISFVLDNQTWELGRVTDYEPYLIKKQQRPNRPGRGRNRHWMEVDDEKGADPVFSPDRKKKAYIKNDNVYVCDSNGKNERALSNDGTQGNYYSSYIKWSPDGQYVCTNKIRPAEKRFVYYVESSPKNQLQPILHKQEYAKPGDELRFKLPCAFNVETGKASIPETTLFSKQYDLYGPYWNKEGNKILFTYNERGHKYYRLLEMDPATSEVRTIVEENSPTFVNYNRTYQHFLEDGKQLIWMSERDNWAHLYMIDVVKGKVKHQITKGEWVVRRVLKVDEPNQAIYFTASGVNPDEDPYHVHYYKIGFDGKNMVSLTPQDGNHSAVFNHDYTMLIDKYSKVNEAPITMVTAINKDNTITSQEVAHADISKIKDAGWVAPEIFVAPGRDGKTPMWGIIQRPTNFDPNKKYPIVEYIYSGPGDAYTPKSFNPYNWNMTALAELGFIVVQLDAMGTSYRGKKFEEVCYKNLKDAGFPDRMEWIKAAAKKYPYMDSTRVGIFGASAGGQEAMAAVLFHPDFYKAAYSSCGCHDNRMDKIWWNEQWMSYPIDSSYVESSNVENAHKLSRPLMLVVGELDDNVDPASTMQVVNALIKANKDFELVVLPGVGHSMGERFGEHKRYDFFVRHLMEVNPPKWDEIGQ